MDNAIENIFSSLENDNLTLSQLRTLENKLRENKKQITLLQQFTSQQITGKRFDTMNKEG